MDFIHQSKSSSNERENLYLQQRKKNKLASRKEIRIEHQIYIVKAIIVNEKIEFISILLLWYVIVCIVVNFCKR